MGGTTPSFDIGRADEGTLRDLVAGLLANNEALQSANAVLKDRLRALEKLVFGPRTEQLKPFDVKQPGLLPFPDFVALQAKAQEAAQVAAEQSVDVPAHKRKKHGRRADFPESLPRERENHRIPDEQRTCCGKELRIIGHEISKLIERLETCYVHEDHCEKGVCDECGKIVVAPAPPRVLDRCLMGAGFLARVIFERFANHMPYARLEKKYAHEGLDLSRSVLCSSVLRCAELLQPVYDAHRKDVLAATVVQADDTEVIQRFGQEKGRQKVNVWVYRDQDGGAFYEMTVGRARDGPRAVLASRSGLLQCDGHTCFDGLSNDTERVGCWAHVRRKFVHAVEGGDELARVPLDLIGKLFAIEARGKDLSTGELLAVRQLESRPLVEKLKDWLDQQRLQPPSAPKSPLMKAVGYALNQWATLTVFLADGRIRDITNNGAERALRSIVIGRKNWLFFGDEEGARLGPILMSLVQSCKELAINPLLYLTDVLKAISTTPADRVAELTPRGWQRRQQAKANDKPTLADVVPVAVR